MFRLTLIVIIVLSHLCTLGQTNKWKYSRDARELFDIVNSTVLSIDGIPQNKTYLLLNNIAREIKDPDTVISLNFDPSTLISVNHETMMNFYGIGNDLPAIKYTTKDADDAVRMYILRSSEFNGNLVKNTETVGNYINPSVFKFRDRLLLVCSLQMGLTGSKRKHHTKYIEFRWVNNTKYPFYTEGSYLGVENEVEGLNAIIYGEDPRVLVHNDSYFQIYFTSILGVTQPVRQRMGVAEGQFIPGADARINITYIGQPMHVVDPLDGKGSQKNWSPFIYRGEVYLIAFFSPMIVVKMSGYGSDMLNSVVVSISNKTVNAYFDDPLSIRGGTNAIRINDDVGYLGFFHSRVVLPFNVMTTYVFGAYTFSAEPPFEMLKISPTPIMPEQFYTGQWSSRFIDYCMYPMHIFLENGTIHMSLGYQDQFGVLVEMELDELLRTLVPLGATRFSSWAASTSNATTRHNHHRRGE